MIKIALVTCPPNEARSLARAVIDSGTAACVNQVSGVSSVYRWNGVIQEDAETLLIIKTNIECIESLRETIMRLHSYDTPEFLVLDADPDGSSPDYVSWIMNTVRSTTA